jgi:hypothetical protein
VIAILESLAGLRVADGDEGPRLPGFAVFFREVLELTPKVRAIIYIMQVVAGGPGKSE